MTEGKGIRIKNIYYMLCYVYQTLWQLNYQGVQTEEFEHSYSAGSNFWKGDARCENPRQPAVPVSKKQEVLELLHDSASNRTDRGAIRPYGNQNFTGIRKDVIYCNKTASLLYGLNTPLFLHTLHESRICKKS